MEYSNETNYMKGFLPYALAAFLVGIVGGLSTVLGPSFMLDMNLAYNNTTWSALAQAISTAACAPILGKLGDIFGRRKTLLLGILVFTLGSILSALSTSLLFLLVAKMNTLTVQKKIGKKFIALPIIIINRTALWNIGEL